VTGGWWEKECSGLQEDSSWGTYTRERGKISATRGKLEKGLQWWETVVNDAWIKLREKGKRKEPN